MVTDSAQGLVALERATRLGKGLSGSRTCLICQSADHEIAFTEFGIDILECRNCGHLFSTYQGDPHYDGFWGDHVPEGEQFYWSRARARMHHDFVERFVAHSSGRLLDMGCGLGFFLKVIAPYPNWLGYGCEVSSAAVRYARQTVGLRHVQCAHLEDCSFQPGAFDLITMWDVLDHILHPDPMLQRCHSLLRPDGTLFIRIPNAPLQLFRARMTKRLRGMQSRFAYLQARDHMHHYSARTIRVLLERNGFDRVDFLHLHPIESVKKSNRVWARTVKNIGFAGVRALAAVSAGRMNLDNLFVAARKA